MAKFQYKAMNISGKLIEGVYDAPNQQAVIEMIRQKSFYNLEVKEITERKDINEMGFLARIKTKEISIYCRQFASILRAGVPLIQCLSMLEMQTENKILQKITKEVCEEVQKGSGLSQAMDMHNTKLPSILINMVAAGEASGTLDNSFEVMAEHFEKEHNTQQKVKSALRYPIIVAIVAVLVVIIMLVKVVPVFAGMFASAGAALPAPTRILLSLSDFMQENGFMIFLIFVVLAASIKIYLSGDNGRMAFDRFKFFMPVFGKFQIKSVTARFARTMATLMSTGVSITEALEITGNVMDNIYVQKGIKKVIDQVKEGKGLFIPIKSLMLFPPMLENMIMLGEESGTLDSMLIKTADFYEEEVDRAAQALTSMIEPMVILVLGGIVAFIVLAIALPMFDSYNFAA